MNRSYPVEFVYQVAALFLAVILVHAIYVAWVRPEADEFRANQIAEIQANPDYQPQRSLFVIVRDFEQEACFILMLWAMAIMAFKAVSARGEARLLHMAFIPREEGEEINVSKAATMGKRLRTLPEGQRGKLLPRTLATALGRFAATHNIQDAADTAHDLCQAEADRLESELSMVRYLAWAIPSIGFIGTVRGIGEALAQAHKAVEGDIAGVTRSLGVAFNSTLVALLISIVIMFLLHQVQLQQDRLVLDTEHYLDDHLIEHLRVERG